MLELLIGFGGAVVITAALRVVRERGEQRTAERLRHVLYSSPEAAPELVEGARVRVAGVVRALEPPIEALLSANACIAYCARVRVAQRMYWLERPREVSRMVRFAIERDGGDQVIVDSNDVCLIDLPTKTVAENRRCIELAISRGIASGDRRGAIYEEMLVLEGATAAVSGLLMKDIAKTPSNDDRGFRDAPTPALRLVGDKKHPIIIGPRDRPRDW